MMVPPSTLLEMHKFMRDELQGNEKASEQEQLSAQNSQHRLMRVVRMLFGRRQCELDTYCESDRVESAAI